MEIVYTGPHAAVVIPVRTGPSYHVKRNVPVDLPDDLAASLLDQSTWQRVKSEPPKRRAAKTAETAGEDES